MTEDLSVWSLASGSKANCTFIKSANTSILVDYGVSCRKSAKYLQSLGVNLKDLDGVFITHEHSDHIGGLVTFFKNYKIPVHMTEGSYLAYIRGKGFDFRDKITVHPPIFTVKVGDLTVNSLPVPHDSAECVAYKITSDSGDKFGICTDVGCPKDDLLEFFSDCRGVITEANHDVTMLKCGIYPEELKYRILSDYGHTSNDDCAEFIIKLIGKGVKNFMLAHLSKENNTPELALYTVNEALKRENLVTNKLLCAPADKMIRFL